jgi:hypothetical protein
MRDRVLPWLGEQWEEVVVTPDLARIPRVVSGRKREEMSHMRTKGV